MCGICGELRFDGAPSDIAIIRQMTSKLARRGPDHEGIITDGPLAFGHRRLAIIDLSDFANQPMVDKTLKLALVFNGTIYNYKALRKELVELGYEFFSEGDSEVILKAYHAWGEKCVERFYGMFAFAIWDMRHLTLFMARDRFGIKPLYYALDGASLRFASSIQALLAAGGIDTSIDPIALHHHFTLHAVVPAPRTILNGVKKLPPATTMTISAEGQVSQRRYWHLNATRPAHELSEQDWLKATRTVLTRAVERHRLASDVPVGVLLSGGLDSSLLVGLLADHVDDLLTFSVGFEDVGEGAEKADEFEYSDQVVERFKTRHHKYLIPNAEVLKRLPEAVANMAEPMVGQDAVAFYLLGETRCGRGEGGAVRPGCRRSVRRLFLVSAHGRRLRLRRWNVSANTISTATMPSTWKWSTPAYHVPDVTAELVERELTKPDADSFLDQVLRFDATTLIVDDPVKRVDNMTMAWGLEARVPFLDHELVELAARMPPSLRLKEGGKFPLKAIARGLVPDAVIDRPKGYFPVPALKYVRGDFLEFMRDILMSDACIRRGLYNRAYVDKLLAEPEAHFTRIQGSKLWHLALLELWLQINIDAPHA